MPSTIQVDVDDVPKHERVAHALEQINGLRYRYKGAAAKPQKKNINDDSDEGEMTDGDDDDVERAEAKARRASRQPLTLDDHIERMLLRTRTIALLKIANNTAQVLPDEDEDDEEEGDGYGYGDDGYCEAYDENDEEQFSGRTEDDDGDEKSDRFDSVLGVASPPESHSSSMHRIDSMRRPMSFRTTSFRSNGSSKGDPEEMAALRLVRKLSTFLSLPKVISYQDLEEITESLLDEPHDESEEYAHLIDEHIDSARDSSSGDGSVAGDGGHHSGSSHSLAHRRTASQKSLRDLNIVEDPEDLDLQQRRLYVENAGLVRYSSKRLLNASSHNLLRGSSQLSMNSVGSCHGGGFGSIRHLGGSPTASSHNVLGHKDSKRSLNRGESWRSSGGGGGAGSITEENDDKYNEDNEDEEARDGLGCGGLSGALGGGVLGTTFDEHGYKQWRTEIKDDYLAWLHAKVEAKKQRRAQRQKDAGQKPRWLLLYEAASKGTRHGSEVESMAADRKQSVGAPPRGAARKSVS